MRRGGSLSVGAVVFVATWIVHSADHVRRGLDASPDAVIWAGTLVAVMAAASVTLIVTGHPTAPFVAAVVFPSIAIGVALSHLPPDWGPLSDPILVDSATDAWSVPAVGAEVLAAGWLGAAAVGIVRRHGYAVRVPPAAWAG